MCTCVRLSARVCVCKGAHALGLVSDLIIAHLDFSVRAGESNGLFILV